MAKFPYKLPALVTAAFVIGFLAALGLTHLLNRPTLGEPDTSAIKDSLHSVADRAIQMPSLTDADIELAIDQIDLTTQVKRIKKLAEKLGGAAIEGVEDKTGTEVLAQIPPQFSQLFLQAVKEPNMEPLQPQHSADAGTALVQVKLKVRG